MQKILFSSFMALVLLSACEQTDVAAPPLAQPTKPDSWLIRNVTVIDGSGLPGTPASVRISGATIQAVGELDALPGETVVDGGGQVLAPGFIDTHSHADSQLFEQPGALNAVSQGITTAIVGQDGGVDFFILPLSDFFARLEAQPAAINIAAYAAHNNIRSEVMGENFQRNASAAEIEHMESLLEADLAAGALGLSTGLEYDPGIYSDRTEMLHLARVTAQHGGRYISHIRSEDRWFDEAIEETISVGRETGMPVQISHLKLAMKSHWGQAPQLLAKLDAARGEGIDITADIYPYEYWQSYMYVLLPERERSSREEVEFTLSELAPPAQMLFSKFDKHPEYVGKTLAELAELRDMDAVSTFMELYQESRAATGDNELPADKIIVQAMLEEDILVLLSWPHTNVCSDGKLNGEHPRGAGSFPRVLGRYARELGVIPLEQAIHKMSGLSAAHMGITDRGLIEPGMAADLVLFDPASVIDHATPQDPLALSTGITQVWVNGVTVFENGAVSGNYPGVIIRRKTEPE